MLGVILLKAPLLLRIGFVLSSPYLPGGHLAGDCLCTFPSMGALGVTATTVCYHGAPERHAEGW